MNFEVFVKGTVYEPLIILMFITYQRDHKFRKFLFFLKLISSPC